MKKTVHKSALVILTAAMICTAACGGQTVQTTPASENTEKPVEENTAPVTIIVGYSTGDTDPRGIALAKMKQTVEEKTGGGVIMEIHPSGELGSDADLISGLIGGSVDMTVSSAGNYAKYATRMGVSALPFLFSDFESAWSFVDSPTMSVIAEELEPFNIHVLAYFDNGFRCVTTSDKAINSPSDMKGLNIRTPENQIVMETMSALGASPQSFPFAQLKDALKDGTFDAQENPIPVIYNNKLYEVQKYLSITNHSYDAMPLTIRSDLWNSLRPEYRDIIEEAAKTAQNDNRIMVKQQTEELVEKLKSEGGMEVNSPDLTPFKEATTGVIDVFADIYGDELIAEVKALTE